MKTRILQLVLMAALVLSLGVPVYAAVDETNENIARSSTQYVDFNLTIYSGVITYSNSGQNYSGSSYVLVNSSTVSPINIGIYDTIGQAICSLRAVNVPGSVSFSPSNQYPGQYIRVGFYKTGIEGSRSVSGKFYYDGL